MATLILKETHRILIEKIEALNKEKRETSLRIREAADQGDLKENAEYHAAREHQSLLVYKIQLMQSHAPFKWRQHGDSEPGNSETAEDPLGSEVTLALVPVTVPELVGRCT